MSETYIEELQEMSNDELLDELINQAMSADEEDLEIVNAIKEEISLRMVA